MALISNTGSLTITTASSSVPSWYPSSAGQTVQIPFTNTISAAATAAGAGGSMLGVSGNIAGITNAWSGGALIYISGQPYLVVKGYGHTDGAWNGLLKGGPLTGPGSNTPSWTVFLAGSALGAIRNATTYTDGRASATHTYNNLVGVADVVYEMGLDAYYSSGGSAVGPTPTYAFRSTGQTQISGNPRNTRYGCATHYQGNIYYFGGYEDWEWLRIYNIAGNSWTSESNGQIFMPDTGYMAIAADTNRGRLLASQGSEAVYWNINPPTYTRRTGLAGPGSWTHSLHFDPGRDVFVSFVSGSNTIRELSASSLASGGTPSWTTRTLTGVTPPAGEAAGTFNRIQHVPELFGFVRADTSTSTPVFMRSV
jgi:hypothetical protein